ncbi:MAG: YceD family protein [Chitinophagales bacterium]
MDNNKIFNIPFVGLKNRIHQFDFKIDGSFFKNFENSTNKNCEVDVKVELDKRDNYLIFIFYIDGHIFLDCDRCLDKYKQEIFGDYKLIVQLGGKLIEDNDNDDDIIAIAKNSDFIDISKPIYDYILLSIPFKQVHKNIEMCNAEMIKKMKKEENKENKIDPRWDILNKLKK